MKKFNIWKQAFTLIELMIVVVILWVLMSTILPKLTWAQARARDAWRVADVSNIAAALQVYYDDNGHYPALQECLSSSGTIWTWLAIYMQSQKVPEDPQPTANSYFCADKWKYFYSAVIKDWMDNNAYVLCADMETKQKANTAAALVMSTAQDFNTTVTEYATLQPLVWASTKAEIDAADTAWANQSVYCILRP